MTVTAIGSQTSWWRKAMLLAAAWAGAALCTLALVSVVLQAAQARQALQARTDTAAAASRRIDQLQDDLQRLNERLALTEASASAERADLLARMGALSEQIRRLGGDPVVVAPPSTTTATTGRATPTTTPPPANPPTTTPQPTPTTAPTTTQPPPPPTTAPSGICSAPLVGRLC